MKEWADYTDLLFLGESNHGLYFRARPPERMGLKSDVAIKVLVSDSSDDQWHSVAREIELLKKIGTEFVVKFHEAGHKQGRLYYAMEYAVMGTLARPSRELTTFEKVRALGHGARGLAELHALGVIHRDIKPAKILVHEHGGKLNDLGIAGEHVGEAGDAIPTGSIGYMAPEVARGDHATPASDIFSIGATLYRIIADKSLYPDVPNDNLQAAIGHIATTPPAYERLNTYTNLFNVIERCVAVLPEARPSSALAVASDIEAALQADSSPAMS